MTIVWVLRTTKFLIVILNCVLVRLRCSDITKPFAVSLSNHNGDILSEKPVRWTFRQVGTRRTGFCLAKSRQARNQHPSGEEANLNYVYINIVPPSEF